jgi:predicted ATPase
MPEYRSFTVKNFKGIEETTIELSDRVRCPVITLIGLNESGKTTVLEAISHFVSEDKSVSDLFQGFHAKSSGTGLIPLHRKAAFSSAIEIIGVVQMDQDDVKKAKDIAAAHKFVLNEELLAEPFPIHMEMKFEDSVFKSSVSYWHFRMVVKAGRSNKWTYYQRPLKKPKEVDVWAIIQQEIKKNLPQIAYFPTFLVDMPSRIYLKEYPGESTVNRHYRFVFQDILDSLHEGLSLDKHICARVADFRALNKTPAWFSLFFGSPEKAIVDSVFQKLSNAVTREVLGSWQRVFQRASSAKSISVEWNIDTELGDVPYASFFVSDGESRYAISERSLGFRWFFSFLLFTGFKQAKNRKTVFIFDEPAANLHAKAQAELLTSFSKIASEGNRIIYSTHSHHMINPQWLSGAYIVENLALDYDSVDNFGLAVTPTKIRATKYREFVANSPNRSSYFQPVIEKLEYSTPALIGEAPYVIVEGITDYYALRLATMLSRRKFKFNLMPGAGAGASGPLISLLLGRGDRFLLLLDDDKAGKKESDRYQSGWFLDASSVMTLGNIDSRFSGKRLEGLITADTLELISKKNELGTAPSKKQIGWFLAEICAGKPQKSVISTDTLANLILVLEGLAERLASNSDQDNRSAA